MELPQPQRPGVSARGQAAQGVLRGAAAGARLPLAGVRLLRRHRKLWVLAAVPVAIATIAVSVALGLLIEHAALLNTVLTGWMPTLVVEHWLAWLWVGPAIAVLWLLGGLLFLIAAAAALLASLLLANVASAPFLDVLSRRVERVATGTVREIAAPGVSGMLSDAGRALWNELQRIFFFASVSGGLLLLGWIIPGAGFVTAPAAVAFAVLFLPLDFAGYTLDRRQLRFRERRAWVRAHLPQMAGFGSVALLVSLVPGLNFLLAPALVAAGTLLVDQLPPSTPPH